MRADLVKFGLINSQQTHIVTQRCITRGHRKRACADDLGCLDTFLWIFGLANWIPGIEISINIATASIFYSHGGLARGSPWFNTKLRNDWLEYSLCGSAAFGCYVFDETKRGKNRARHNLDTSGGGLGF